MSWHGKHIRSPREVKVASKADIRAILSRSFPHCQCFLGGFRFRHRRRPRQNSLCLGSPACFRRCRWRDVAPRNSMATICYRMSDGLNLVVLDKVEVKSSHSRTSNRCNARVAQSVCRRGSSALPCSLDNGHPLLSVEREVSRPDASAAFQTRKAARPVTTAETSTDPR